MSKEGMKTLRNSAEKMPPFFMTPLFLILRDTERRGCLKWNSLIGIINQPINANLNQYCYPLLVTVSGGESTYFGGMFSGLLDQSETQSTSLFSRMSSSLSCSGPSSSDCTRGGKEITF